MHKIMINDSMQDSQSLHLSAIVWPNKHAFAPLTKVNGANAFIARQSHSVVYSLEGNQTTNGLLIVVYILSWHKTKYFNIQKMTHFTYKDALAQKWKKLKFFLLPRSRAKTQSFPHMGMFSAL